MIFLLIVFHPVTYMLLLSSYYVKFPVTLWAG